MNIDFPCVCGHPKKDHAIDYDAIKTMDPYIWGSEYGCRVEAPGVTDGTKLLDDCANFRPDNLKYLEAKLNEKSLDTSK